MLTHIKKSKFVQVFVIGILLASALTVSVQAVTSVTATSGASAAFQYVEAFDPDSIDEECTTSTSWTDIPNLTRTFNQGGVLASDPVLVTLNVELSNGGSGFLRLVADGTPQSGSSGELWIGNMPSYFSRNFVTNNVASGQHTIKFQYKAVDSEIPLCVKNRSMAIFHRSVL